MTTTAAPSAGPDSPSAAALPRAGAQAAATTSAPLRRNRDFRLLLTAQGVSAAGTEVTSLALPLAATLLLHASPLVMGLLTATGWLPSLLLSLPAGAWADRLPRRRPLLIAADLAAAAALVTVPLAWAAGRLTVVHLLAVAFALGSGRTLARPAFQSHLPDVVPADRLTAASAALASANSAATMIGPGLGGLLVQLLAAPVAVLADAVSFLASALCLHRVRSPEHAPAHADTRSLRRDIGEGLRALFGERAIAAATAAAGTLNLAGAMVESLYVVFAVRALGLPAGLIGLIGAVSGAGGLLGAAVASRVVARFGPGRTIVAATGAFGLTVLGFPLAGGPTPVAAAVLGGVHLLFSIAAMLFVVSLQGLILGTMPRQILGRINATMTLITMGAMPVGALAGGALGAWLGLRPALWVAAAVGAASLLWTWFSPLRARRPAAPPEQP